MSSPHYIYVHVPFCEQKCTYCDFFTITDPDGIHPLAPVWLDLCAREIELLHTAGQMDTAQPVRTVFFGGGTPSLLQPQQIQQFLHRLRNQFSFTDDVEITLETQPNTVDAARLHLLAQAGVNRFSIGIQTFDAAILARTGRRHTVEQSRVALREAASTGRTVSLDLICAWPGQTLQQWQHDLAEALTYNPAHISVYELTYHVGTLMSRARKAGELTELDEDLRIAMYEHTRGTLMSAGYEHYEISNYARPGARSIHNQNYWQLGDYIGLGAGAHSLAFPNRYQNPNSAADYARTIQEGCLFRRLSNTADPDVFVAENLQMALRDLQGLDLAAFGRKMGRDILQERADKLHELETTSLIQLTGATLRLTPEGELRSDSIVEHLL